MRKARSSNLSGWESIFYQFSNNIHFENVGKCYCNVAKRYSLSHHTGDFHFSALSSMVLTSTGSRQKSNKALSTCWWVFLKKEVFPPTFLKIISSKHIKWSKTVLSKWKWKNALLSAVKYGKRWWYNCNCKAMLATQRHRQNIITGSGTLSTISRMYV